MQLRSFASYLHIALLGAKGSPMSPMAIKLSEPWGQGWSPLHSLAAGAGSESGEGEGHSPQSQGGPRTCGDGG